MKSGFIYFTNDEISKLKSLLSKSKDEKSFNVLNKISYYEKMSAQVDSNYIKLATDKYVTANEDIVIDDDDIISKTNSGAYVHAWVWIENKPKRKRRKVENE
jgi:hypothetical protein